MAKRTANPFLVMGTVVFLAVELIAAVILFLACAEADRNAAHAFFASNLRGSMFAGFLTLGGFLLSLKTFSLIHLKQGLYDDKDYLTHVEAVEDAEGTPVQVYRPLVSLYQLFFAAIFFSFTSAVAQLTIGLIRHWFPVTICISLAIATVTLIFVGLFRMRSDLETWFEHLDKKDLDRHARNARRKVEKGDASPH